MMNPWLLTLPLAYLLGSIPFGYLLVRIFRKEDIRAVGSGNIGATNVARSGAKGLGLLTLLLDLLKAFAAVKLGQHFSPGVSDLAMGAALAALLGHVFPVWLGFRGGKGVASAIGVFLALNWPSALGIFGTFLVVVLITRYVSLGSVMGAASVPLFALYFVRSMPPFVLTGYCAIALIVIVKHHANLRRVLAGTESRFGSKAGPAGPAAEHGAGRAGGNTAEGSR